MTSPLTNPARAKQPKIIADNGEPVSIVDDQTIERAQVIHMYVMDRARDNTKLKSVELNNNEIVELWKHYDLIKESQPSLGDALNPQVEIMNLISVGRLTARHIRGGMIVYINHRGKRSQNY